MTNTHAVLWMISLALPTWALWSAEREARSNEADLYAQIGHFIRSRL